MKDRDIILKLETDRGRQRWACMMCDQHGRWSADGPSESTLKSVARKHVVSCAVPYVNSGYLSPVMTPEGLSSAIAYVCDLIRRAGITDKFDAIAFRGVSGSMVAPLVCQQLGKFPIIVRKDTDGSHSSDTVEGYAGCRYSVDEGGWPRHEYMPFRYIIVDDFIDSGKTVRAIVDEMGERVNCGASKLIGVVLWGRQSIGGLRPCVREDRYVKVTTADAHKPGVIPVYASQGGFAG